MRKTYTTIKTLLISFKEGATTTEACKNAGIARSIFYSWCDQHPKLALRIEQLKKYRIPLVIDSLVNQCLKGNVQAIKFYLINKDKWKTGSEVNISASASSISESKSEIAIDPDRAKSRLQENSRIIERYRLLDSAHSEN